MAPPETGGDDNAVASLDNYSVDVSDTVRKPRGVSEFWKRADHIALIVSDVGKSLDFYTDIVGMQQIMRPDFDRHGAWLTFGNIDLHLIKGKPAIIPDDPDLIVPHIAIPVSNMDHVRDRLRSFNFKWRKNISVPDECAKGPLDQAFCRDPDGHYIEFCNCDHYAKGKGKFTGLKPTIQSRVDKLIANAKQNVLYRRRMARKQRTKNEKDILTGLSVNNWRHKKVCQKKLKRIKRRRFIYSDVMQTINSDAEAVELLKRFDNDIPKLHDYLLGKEIRSGTQTMLPPAFYERDGKLYQPKKIMLADDNNVD